MPHALHRATLALHTPLGTPLAGDTLFGQLCWALREAAGEVELGRRLEGYTAGEPWLVVSDGFPAGYLPRPTLPQHLGAPCADPAQRKAARKRRWLPFDRTGETLAVQLAGAVDDQEAHDGQAPQAGMVAHNTLNRLSGTTGEGAFAPYTAPQIFHSTGQRIDVYLVLDSERTGADEVGSLLSALGSGGFGRDASVGLGKFTLQALEATAFAVPAGANAWWTLAPSAPRGQGFVGSESYWRVLTRFGRHGNVLALADNPFKTPVLLAATGAVLVPAGGFSARSFIGQGSGGAGILSKAEAATVHQGYAPVAPLALEPAP